MKTPYSDENLRLVYAEQEKDLLRETIRRSRFTSIVLFCLCAVCFAEAFAAFSFFTQKQEYVSYDCSDGCPEEVVAQERKLLGLPPGTVALLTIVSVVIGFSALFGLSDSAVVWMKAEKNRREHEVFLAKYNRDIPPPNTNNKS